MMEGPKHAMHSSKDVSPALMLSLLFAECFACFLCTAGTSEMLKLLQVYPQEDLFANDWLSCSNVISKVYIIAFFWIVKLPEGRLHPNITLRSKKETSMHSRSCSLSRLLSLDPCFLEWQREDDFAFWVLELPSAGELPILGLPWMAHGASAQTAWCGAANANRQQTYLA